MEDRLLDAFIGMERGDDPNPRADPHVPSDRDAPRAVEEALLADPRAVADHEAAAMVALEDREVTHVDTSADVHVPRVEDEDVFFDDRSLTEPGKLLDRPSAAAMRSARRQRLAGHSAASRRSTTVAC